MAPSFFISYKIVAENATAIVKLLLNRRTAQEHKKYGSVTCAA